MVWNNGDPRGWMVKTLTRHAYLSIALPAGTLHGLPWIASCPQQMNHRLDTSGIVKGSTMMIMRLPKANQQGQAGYGPSEINCSKFISSSYTPDSRVVFRG
jgi:putative component of membrane protein insertase Oxa1/YidC/SpoIIIJ protein YidD